MSASEVTEKFVYDAANEQVVIQAAMDDDQVRRGLVRQLSPSQFYASPHSTVWEAMITLTNKGLVFDTDTFLGLARTSGLVAKDEPYVIDLIENAGPTANLGHHVETMLWDSKRANALKGPIPKLIQAVSDPQISMEEVQGSARAIASSFKGGIRRHARRPEEQHRSYMASMNNRKENKQIFPLGYDDFDARLTDGFAPGKTSILSGLPGAGKTTVAVAMATALAKVGRRPFYCSWEMGVESTTDIFISHLTGIELRDIVQGTWADSDFRRIERASLWIASKIRFMSNPFFDDIRAKKKPSNDRNLDLLESYIAESGCDVAIYDLWERMLYYLKPEDVTRALYRMQNMHEEYGIHGMILQQLRLKDVEKRADKRPTRDAIKGTGAYVEVADLIFGIHREAQFKSVEDNGVETICLKQRKGVTNWSFRWEWDGAICRVRNPREVSFDPGLESAEMGDIGEDVNDISQIKTRKSKKRTIGKAR